jgi:hypothetical protein
MEYLTRLTPNFLCWDRPSGRDGKCSGGLFEAHHGFGWEEWLLRDYHANKNKPDHVCQGFIQAFNGKNQGRKVNTLHLYTRVCNNQFGIKPGYYYLGYIENIQSGNFGKYNASDVKTDLRNVSLRINSTIEVRNVQFLVKDVHFHCLNKTTKYPIRLGVGQFRFALYDLNTHQHLQTEIKK